MELREFTISPDAFERVAHRLQELGRQIPEDEQAVLRAIVILAGEHLDQIEDADVEGFGYETEPMKLADASGFRLNFDSTFGAFRGKPTSSLETTDRTGVDFSMIINGIF